MKRAALLRARVQDGVQLALPDDDVHLTADAGVGEQLLDVEQAAGAAVDRVVRAARAEHGPRDRHLGVVDRQGAVGVVDGEADLGTAERRAAGGAGEDDVLHLAAAQALGALLAHHPAERVDDVGLPRPVRPDHAGDAGLEAQGRRGRERLEASQGQGLQVHVRGSPHTAPDAAGRSRWSGAGVRMRGARAGLLDISASPGASEAVRAATRAGTPTGAANRAHPRGWARGPAVDERERWCRERRRWSCRRSPRRRAPGSVRGPARWEPLAIWLLSRVAVVVLTVASAWTLARTTAGRVPGFLDLWYRWDVVVFAKIGEFGYQGYPRYYPDTGTAAFFPGEPIALRLAHLVTANWAAAGLLVSLVAGGVAVDRDGAARGPGPRGRRRVASGALPGRLPVRRVPLRRVLRDAVPRPGGGLVARRRGNGAGCSREPWPAWPARSGSRGRSSASPSSCSGSPTPRAGGGAPCPRWCCPGPGSPRSPSTCMRSPGDWLAWQHVEADAFGRHLEPPWTSFLTTWHAAGDPAQPSAFAWSFGVEIVALAVGAALTVVLLVRRDWGEAVYVGGQVAALATSSFYASVARATLVWWPLWILLAVAAARYRWVHAAYLTLAVPLAAAGVVAFTQGQWVG